MTTPGVHWEMKMWETEGEGGIPRTAKPMRTSSGKRGALSALRQSKVTGLTEECHRATRLSPAEKRSTAGLSEDKVLAYLVNQVYRRFWLPIPIGTPTVTRGCHEYISEEYIQALFP